MKPVPQLEPRPEIRDLPAAVHGAMDFAELKQLGLMATDIVDFSANINPFGPSAAVRGALAQVAPERYPDREAHALRGALAETLGVAPNQLIVGNGACEMIGIVALAFVRPGDRVMILGPTFAEYERMTRMLGAAVVEHQAHDDDGFAIKPSDCERLLGQLRPRIAFVCNPNNPTGAALPAEVIRGWAKRHAETLFVVDEAYLAFAADMESVLTVPSANLLVLRSMTKDYALAGLRLGYAVSHAKLIDWLARVRTPWNVNAIAQAAGVAALRDQDHLRQSLARLCEAKAALLADLTKLGVMTIPSTVHFFLAYVGNGAAVRMALLRRGLLVRDASSFGLPSYVRISTRRPEENQRLVAALREVL